ncbi:D-isomer specific 2-hydroxyacid dehydrogenase NAD-binding [Proteiniborus sp. DW1]|uniref:NAD(P)-dependent oxidoreductase n=1 Tax=Proteiniborus sp. DW1 TaxID=1889883 RepID=UPI00092E0144|nr:NAD(P)-dependent oxidoreductase [Proteiniborus sp. DW1]SCG82298.1 D-isomer specific 2-hydroxyacid dehydrogenase NAD-binding [Proteiniborus sp. DW1]
MKIVVLEPLGISEEEIRAIAKPITDKGHELIVHNQRTTEIEELKERVKGMDVIVLANMPLKGEVIESNDKLKLISVAFTGVDHVDLEVCKENHIIVSNSAGYSTASVAELTYGLIISLLRNIVPLDNATRSGKIMAGFSQTDLQGKILGVIGTGAIGSRVAEIGLAFGCKLVAYNRSENEELKNKGVTYLPLEELLKESDIVTIHLPLTKDTRGLIDAEKLSFMKKDALLINTARGPIVDNKALAEALNNGDLGGAGIDVFDMEPPLPLDYPLLKAPNTVLTPHIGFATKEAMKRRAQITFDNIIQWLDGNPQNRVI